MARATSPQGGCHLQYAMAVDTMQDLIGSVEGPQDWAAEHDRYSHHGSRSSSRFISSARHHSYHS
jgi:hypothetical protein